MHKEERLLRPGEVRDLLNISDDALRSLIKSGKLEAIKISPRITRIYHHSVLALIEEGKAACN